jgi:hypothetical protein
VFLAQRSFFVANVCYFVNCLGEKLGITCSFSVECFFQQKIVTFVKCHKIEKKHFPAFLSGKEKAQYTTGFEAVVYESSANACTRLWRSTERKN